MGKVIRLAGILAAVRDTESTKGEVMRFLTLEDDHGIFGATPPPPHLLCSPRMNTNYHEQISRFESSYS
jgi:hypothetical protein